MTASAENFLKAAQQLERLNLDLALSAGEFGEAIAASLAQDRGHASDAIRRLEDFAKAGGLPDVPEEEARAAALKVAHALQKSSIALYGLLKEAAEKDGNSALAVFCAEAVAGKEVAAATLRDRLAAAQDRPASPAIALKQASPADPSGLRIPETMASKAVRYYQKGDGIEVAISLRVKSWKHQTTPRVLAKAWIALAEAISASRKRPLRKSPVKTAIAPTQPINEAAHPTGSGAWWQF
ncbi:MAG: hypothetical protein ABTQ31_15710 [Rhizobiaceae bacterium]